MTLESLRTILAAHREDLTAMGVRQLAVFGSVARGEARPDSDVDLLVEFDQPQGLFAMARLQRQLAEGLDAPVDLAEPEGLRRPLREAILREAVRAA